MLSRWSRRFPASVWLALVLYAVLAATTVTGVGVVGEVAIGWGVPGTPEVVLGWEPLRFAEGHRLGPLVASQVRPLERLSFAGIDLPLAINTYTGGPPDWPARVLWALTGSAGAVVALHVVLGGLLLVLVHRFLRFHGTDVAAAVAVLALATDWHFLFYRKVLGGTEILLLAAGLLLIWATWSLRWRSGRHGLMAMAVAVGLGLMAKITFVATLAAFAAAVLVTHRDRPDRRPPPPTRAIWMVGVVAALSAPLWLTWLHHGLAVDVEVRSHDYLGLQWERFTSGLTRADGGLAREGARNLSWFFFDPLAWFGPSYGADHVFRLSPWRLVGLLVMLAGTALEWKNRGNSPAAALLRFVSIYGPLQVAALFLANRDLHHLAQATPTLAIWFGLAVDRLGLVVTRPKSPGRAVLALALTVPWMVAGIGALRATDAVLATTDSPSFRESDQAALVALLREHGVEHVWSTDYELYGMLEVRAPEIRHTSAWADISRRFGRRGEALEALLRAATGAHYLVVQASQPMTYNLRPTPGGVQKAAGVAGVTVTELATLSSGEQTWAWLYEVGG